MGLFKKNAKPKSVDKGLQTETVTDSEIIKDAELVAVIGAAIQAYESETGATTNLIIRKIDRIAGVVPAWGVAGNREQIDTRRM